MKMHEVKRLSPGDEVHWEDPDNNIASRYITIRNIEIKGNTICIYGISSDYLECFTHELS